jgi:hypothetical protein
LCWKDLFLLRLAKKMGWYFSSLLAPQNRKRVL